MNSLRQSMSNHNLVILKKRVTVCLSLCLAFGYSQTKTDSLAAKQPATVQVGDSIIDGKIIKPQKAIPVKKDSLAIKDLEDLPEAFELDKKWLAVEELESYIQELRKKDHSPIFILQNIINELELKK